MLIFYRVTYENKGIYNELKNMVDINTWKELLESNEINWLPKPPSYAENNKSYFTEKGYKKFTKNVLPIIENYLSKDKIKISSYQSLENIIYEDEYQVVTKN